MIKTFMIHYIVIQNNFVNPWSSFNIEIVTEVIKVVHHV
jgi:hypothetical protein